MLFMGAVQMKKEDRKVIVTMFYQLFGSDQLKQNLDFNIK